MKQVAVLGGVHVYQLGAGSHDSGELLTNESFEEGRGTFLPGWKMVGKPRIDRTGKYSSGGRAGCGVSTKDFLLSAPVPVEPGECYRLALHQRAESLKPGKLLLQLDWKSENQQDVHDPTSVLPGVRSAQHWQESSMIARAPAGSRYAVVHAGAASGKIWVDDYSLTKIPNDCEPELFITPNPVSVPASQSGRAAVSWNACCDSQGRVTLRVNDDAEQAFAAGQSGLAFLDGIKPGMRYELRLYSQQQSFPIQTAALGAVERTDTIAADPNPVPSGPGLGRTRISWATLAERDAEVWVSQDGRPEQLFARGPTGSAEANWIVNGSSYEFRLYSREQPRRVLAKTVVKR